MDEKEKKEIIFNKLLWYKETKKLSDQKELLLQELEQLSNNPAHREIISRSGISGKIIIFFKKVIRRCLKWYINPICDQQTHFNVKVSEGVRFSINQNIKERLELEKHIERLDKIYHDFIDSKYKMEEIERKFFEQNQRNNFIEQELKRIENEKDKILTTQFETIPGTEVISTAQSGEDCIIKYVLLMLGIDLSQCTYVDLGANHAKFLSNTFWLYTQGARGVLVEANPQLVRELKVYRPGDTVLNKCIDTESGKEIPFYVLDGDGLSTPDYSTVEQVINENKSLHLVETVQVGTITINDVFEFYARSAPTVLNIDIEGKELEILESISLEKYRPFIIICEMIEYHNKLVVGEKNKSILEYMETNGYIEYANTGINSIFIDKSELEKRGVL